MIYSVFVSPSLQSMIRWSAVFPFSHFALMSAPFLTSSFTISRFLATTASYRGVLPFLSWKLKSWAKWLSVIYLMYSTLLFRAAKSMFFCSGFKLIQSILAMGDHSNFIAFLSSQSSSWVNKLLSGCWFTMPVWQILAFDLAILTWSSRSSSFVIYSKPAFNWSDNFVTEGLSYCL